MLPFVTGRPARLPLHLPGRRWSTSSMGRHRCSGYAFVHGHDRTPEDVAMVDCCATLHGRPGPSISEMVASIAEAYFPISHQERSHLLNYCRA